jgi:hypothetical protein
MNNHLASYYIGIFIILASHLGMLTYPQKFKCSRSHAAWNIIAAGMIGYYFAVKEGYAKK